MLFVIFTPARGTLQTIHAVGNMHFFPRNLAGRHVSLVCGALVLGRRRGLNYLLLLERGSRDGAPGRSDLVL